jgi:hypothetical protein
MEVTMRPTTAPDSNFIDLNYLLHPGTAFDHLKDVVAHQDLAISEKRAILARGHRMPPPLHPVLPYVLPKA